MGIETQLRIDWSKTRIFPTKNGILKPLISNNDGDNDVKIIWGLGPNSLINLCGGQAYGILEQVMPEYSRSHCQSGTKIPRSDDAFRS